LRRAACLRRSSPPPSTPTRRLRSLRHQRQEHARWPRPKHRGWGSAVPTQARNAAQRDCRAECSELAGGWTRTLRRDAGAVGCTARA
jgi:hypothetical protein